MESGARRLDEADGRRVGFPAGTPMPAQYNPTHIFGHTMMPWSEAAARARRRLVYERVQRDLRELGLSSIAREVRDAMDREDAQRVSAADIPLRIVEQ